MQLFQTKHEHNYLLKVKVCQKLEKLNKIIILYLVYLYLTKISFLNSTYLYMYSFKPCKNQMNEQ